MRALNIGKNPTAKYQRKFTCWRAGHWKVRGSATLNGNVEYRWAGRRSPFGSSPALPGLSSPPRYRLECPRAMVKKLSARLPAWQPSRPQLHHGNAVSSKPMKITAQKIKAARHSKSRLAPERPCSSSDMLPMVEQTRIVRVNKP